MIRMPPNDSLRILRVSSDTYPEVTGGLGVHVHLMSKRQAEMGHDVTLATSGHGDNDQPRRERRGGYTIERYRELLSPCGNSIAPGIATMLYNRAEQFDIIHAHSHLFFSTNLVAALHRLTETPLVITNHGVRSQEAPEWIQRIFLPTVGRYTLDAADRVLCYTNTDRQRVRDLGVDAPIAVINNGVDCSRFKPTDSETDSSQILYVGRLIEDKGVGVLIRAMSELCSELTDTNLVIVGDGPKRTEFEALAAEEGIAEHVSFTGTVSNDRLPELYNESAVFALPSFNEGFPRTVIEAMACGTPVVTTDLPQLRSIVSEVGQVVPPRDPSALADALFGLLLNDGHRRRLGEMARRHALDRYSWTNTVDQTVDEYYALLDRPRPDSPRIGQ